AWQDGAVRLATSQQSNAATPPSPQRDAARWSDPYSCCLKPYQSQALIGTIRMSVVQSCQPKISTVIANATSARDGMLNSIPVTTKSNRDICFPRKWAAIADLSPRLLRSLAKSLRR